MTAPADWQLPPGVSRAVWDYTHDCTVASAYDADLTDTPLLQADLKFVQRRLRQPGSVIDLGCGTGRIAIPLAQAGHHVVGVDLSTSMLKLAIQKARSAQAPLQLAYGNIVDLPALRDDSFDAALCLFSTLGMISGVESRQHTICEAARVLRPGGQLLVHVHQIGHHIGTRHGRWLLFRDIFRRLKRSPMAGDFPMPARIGSPGWTMHLFTRRELMNLLNSAGLVVEEIASIGIDGQACWPAWRGYGLLVAARKSNR